MDLDRVVEAQTNHLWSLPNAVMKRAMQLNAKHHKNCNCHICNAVRGDICECALCLRERRERLGEAGEVATGIQEVND